MGHDYSKRFYSQKDLSVFEQDFCVLCKHLDYHHFLIRLHRQHLVQVPLAHHVRQHYLHLKMRDYANTSREDFLSHYDFALA